MTEHNTYRDGKVHVLSEGAEVTDYFPIHAHSAYSAMDGMNPVADMVKRVKELDQPAMALTDHGVMSGSVQLYKAAAKAGIKPFLGMEAYVVRDVHDPDTKKTRYHMGLLALNESGFQALTKLSTLSWTADRFYYKPIIDLSDLAFLSQEGHTQNIAMTTGCFSSMAVQALITSGYPAMKSTLAMLAKWFPHSYVELQNHGITWADHGNITDLDIMQNLYQAALELGLPVVFGGDSHYIHPNEQPTHDLMKDICYFGAGEDVHFSGGPYHLLSQDEVIAKSGPMWDDIREGHKDLLAKHDLTIPVLDKFQFFVPRMFKNADKVLRDMAEEGLVAIVGHGLPAAVPDNYWVRLDAELDVIAKMKMANYHLLVHEHLTKWCADNGVIANARGSVNGSLVAYAIGITKVDPIQWATSFDRYLSLDRMKMPDIDMDVDFMGRQRVLAHLKSVYPTLTQVGTFAAIGFGKPDENGEETGSVVVQYMAAMGKKDPHFDRKVKPEHRKPLNALAATTVYKSMGTNAAGVILPGDGHPIDKYLPLARIISSDIQVTQFTKDDVEALGYLKIDVLGLRALQTISGTLIDLGRDPNDLAWIPLDDPKVGAMLRAGFSDGVFQYEGWTARKGAMEMKIKTTQDMIFGLALYRPALMNGGQKDLYLHNRFAPKAKQVRIDPLFDHVVEDTAGVPLYQEQITEMLRAVGMGFTDYNDLMSAIKASNGNIHNAADTFRRLQPTFYDLCEAKGLSDAASDAAWGAIIGFTEYGFNRAHSTSYGLLSYHSAFLKAHYPTQYMKNLLTVWSDNQDKTKVYSLEARRLGLTIVRPDVNESESGWTIDSRPNALRKGLRTIAGIGDKAVDAIIAEREANGRYQSITDFTKRVPARPVSGGKGWAKLGESGLTGVSKALYDVHAFRTCDPV